MDTALQKRRILNAGAIGISYVKLIPDWFRLGKNSLVIDCGANVGYISTMLASTGATVIAFEPDPVAFEKLQQRCGNKKNITLIQKGVWDKNTILHLYAHKNSSGKETSYTVGSSIIADKRNIDISKTQTIEVVDLVTFIQQLNKKVDLVKLDVEGAEIEILKKIIATESWQLFDRMYVETHETKIPSHVEELQAIKKELAEKGITNIKLNWI
jgi:FkbM family methyltransferase